VVGSASIVLAIEEASREANSGGFREEMPQKSRIIPGMGAIAPVSSATARVKVLRKEQAFRSRQGFLSWGDLTSI